MPPRKSKTAPVIVTVPAPAPAPAPSVPEKKQRKTKNQTQTQTQAQASPVHVSVTSPAPAPVSTPTQDTTNTNTNTNTKQQTTVTFQVVEMGPEDHQEQNQNQGDDQEELDLTTAQQVRLMELQTTYRLIQLVHDLCHAFRDDPPTLRMMIDTVTTIYTQRMLAKPGSLYEADNGISSSDETTEGGTAESAPAAAATATATAAAATAPRTRNRRSQKIQLYDPSDLTKVARVIDSFSAAATEFGRSGIISIKNAMKNKTIYKGYRWNIVPFDDPSPQTSRNIGPTKQAATKSRGRVVSLDIDTGYIENVFDNREKAAESVSLCAASISLSIRSQSTTGGLHWNYWDELPEVIKNEYLERTNAIEEA